MVPGAVEWKMLFISWEVLVFYEYYVSCVIWVCLKHAECRGDSVWVSCSSMRFFVGLLRSACICGPGSPLMGRPIVV